MEQTDRVISKERSSQGAEAGFAPAKPTGAFERYRQAVPKERVAQMLAGLAAFSREGPFSAWIVMWLMIFQRLDPKGTLSVAVRELATGPVRAFVGWPERGPAEPLSANTSAYSQARAKLPLEVAEQVSDWIFGSLQQSAKTLPGLVLRVLALLGADVWGGRSERTRVDRVKKHPCLFRLTERRAAKLSGGVEPSAGTDKSIHWVPSREDRRNNPELPASASVEGRLLAFKVRDDSGKRQKLYFFTTLTQLADGILNLYGYRWNIETDLRSLKREVRMHMLEVKTPAMAERELVLGVAAYNLTRAAMNDAGAALNLNPRRFSFSKAQDTLNAFMPLFASATSDPERQRITQRMLRVFAQSKLPNRSQRRSAPRAVWPRPASLPKRRVNDKRCPVVQKGVAWGCASNLWAEVAVRPFFGR
ncbi:MAG: transposase [Bryobacteraceae bacterium]